MFEQSLHPGDGGDYATRSSLRQKANFFKLYLIDMLLPAPGSWKMRFSPAPPTASVGVFRISPSQPGSRFGRGARTWTGARMGQDGTPGNPLMGWGGGKP